MKSCSSWDRHVVESDDSTCTVTLMFGLAFAKALIAVCVCWPSVPSPDSANTMVCGALAETVELEEPELHAAAPVASAAAATVAAAARHRIGLLLIRHHLVMVSSNFFCSERTRLTLSGPRLSVPDDLRELRGHLRERRLRR